MPNIAVLNSIIQNLGWSDRIPEITSENFYTFGQNLSVEEKNEFLGVLGKVAEQFVYSANFNNEENLFSPFFKSDVPVGAFIERLFVGVINPTTPTYNDNGSVSLSRVKPPIQASYYGFNYEVEYKQTISDSQSRSAFLSLDNMNQALNLILLFRTQLHLIYITQQKSFSVKLMHSTHIIIFLLRRSPIRIAGTTLSKP